jgi:hypothetical protein
MGFRQGLGLALLWGMVAGPAAAKQLPVLEASYGGARARTVADRLVVSTGRVERTWQLTERGLVTVGIRDLAIDKQWAQRGEAPGCDWEMPGIDGRASLSALEAHQADDQGFTSPHLEVVATFAYADDGLLVQYVIWAYPQAPGLRTQLRCKSIRARDGADAAAEGIVDSFPVSLRDRTVHEIGYYAGTQNRNSREMEILKEQRRSDPAESGEVDWASVVAVREADCGLILVKESHKCVNTPGLGANTGRFQWDRRGIRNTGTGWHAADLSADRYLPCWATWLVLYRGGDDDMDLALKVYDRLRYPIDPRRDIYILANTWGSSEGMRPARIQAREDNILTEIDSQADLGIDVQQIDDGWQGHDFKSWRPIPSFALLPSDAIYPLYRSDTYPVYPQGWTRVRDRARSKDVKLGLWAAVNIPADDLIWNYEHGDFRYFKLDYADLATMRAVDEVMGKARKLILHSGHQVRINWDLTEKEPRVGYFFGREYGNIYLANRKPRWPAGVVYKPYLVLRDAWQLSRYMNLNKFQITVQNVDRVSRELSDAYLHGHDYCLAQTLMGSPIFFQETHYYTPEARAALRPLIGLYKRHRSALYQGYVFPIGEKPDNGTWSGFQNHDPQTGTGYLLILRQLQNTETRRRIALKFLAGRQIVLTDLQTDKALRVRVPQSGEVEFEIDQAPGYRFLRYEPVAPAGAGGRIEAP